MARITENSNQRVGNPSHGHAWAEAISGFTARLSPDDRKQIAAAEGWLDLGNIIQCLDELNNIPPSNHAHPAVLALYYRIHAETNNWEAAHHAAEMLCHVVPNQPEPWLWRAHALTRMTAGGVAAAIELLAVAATRFPEEPAFAFANALYTCELMRFDESHSWWKAALTIAKRQGTDRQWKIRALTHPDLQPLWHCELAA